MPDELKPPEVASSTGKPMIPLPPWAIGALSAIVAICTAIYGLVDLSPKEQKLCVIVAIVAGALIGTSPGLRKAAPLALLVLSLGLTGCAGAKGFLVSGRTLDEAGAQFELATPVVARQCEAKELPLDVCRGWRDFAHRFQILYRPSVDAWHAAAILNDAALERRYSDMVGPLLAEGAELYATLAQLGVRL